MRSVYIVAVVLSLVLGASLAQAQSTYIRNDSLAAVNGAGNLTSSSAAVDLPGRQVFVLGGLHADINNGCSGLVVDTATTTLFGSPGAGQRWYITGLSCSNNSAVATDVTFRDGPGGQNLWVGALPALASGGQMQVSFPTPLRLSVATSFAFLLGTTATSTRCCATGYRARD